MRLHRLSVLLLCLMLGSPVNAAGPAIVMFYGESLSKPVFITVKTAEDAARYSFFECRSDGNLTTAITARPFVKLAAFWDFRRWDRYLTDPRLLPELDPSQASQHGRLYLPTKSEPAVLIRTQFRNGDPVSIPAVPALFELRCPLSAESAGILQQAGVPGL